MNERNFDEELDALLEELIKSGDSPHELLKRISSEDPELGALLKMAAHIREDLRPDGPDPHFARNAELRILNRMRAAQKRTAVEERRSIRPGWLPVPRFARAAVASLLVVMLVLTGFVGTAAAAGAALPGDSLYSVKLGLEQARLALTFRPQDDLRLLGEYSDERLQEIEGLLQTGRHEALEQAIAAYAEAVDRYEQAGNMAGVDSSDPAVDEKLTQHVEVLQMVKDQVPAQAQSAIQSVIDHQLGHAEQGQPGGDDQGQGQAEEDSAGSGKGPEIRDEVITEQIARQYEVEVEQVQSVFQGQCEADWVCVREYFREQQGIPAGPPSPPIPGPGSGNAPDYAPPAWP